MNETGNEGHNRTETVPQLRKLAEDFEKNLAASPDPERSISGLLRRAADEIERLETALGTVVEWADDLHCFSERGSELAPVFQMAKDALLFSIGFIKTLPDGTQERLDPSAVFIDKKAAAAEVVDDRPDVEAILKARGNIERAAIERCAQIEKTVQTEIEGHIAVWSMRPSPLSNEGKAWEAGARQGWSWAIEHFAAAIRALKDSK